MRRLAGFAETDLVGRDHAIARAGQGRDGAFPGGGAEILAVQYRHRSPVRARRFHIHVRHFHRGILAGETEDLHGMGIVKTFQPRAIDRRILCCRGQCQKKDKQEEGAVDHGRRTIRLARKRERV